MCGSIPWCAVACLLCLLLGYFAFCFSNVSVAILHVSPPPPSVCMKASMPFVHLRRPMGSPLCQFLPFGCIFVRQHHRKLYPTLFDWPFLPKPWFYLPSSPNLKTTTEVVELAILFLQDCSGLGHWPAYRRYIGFGISRRQPQDFSPLGHCPNSLIERLFRTLVYRFVCPSYCPRPSKDFQIFC